MAPMTCTAAADHADRWALCLALCAVGLAGVALAALAVGHGTLAVGGLLGAFALVVAAQLAGVHAARMEARSTCPASCFR